jgi:hypothetical protein
VNNNKSRSEIERKKMIRDDYAYEKYKIKINKKLIERSAFL